jgi:hypothetical protein
MTKKTTAQKNQFVIPSIKEGVRIKGTILKEIEN